MEIGKGDMRFSRTDSTEKRKWIIAAAEELSSSTSTPYSGGIASSSLDSREILVWQISDSTAPGGAVPKEVSPATRECPSGYGICFIWFKNTVAQ